MNRIAHSLCCFDPSGSPTYTHTARSCSVNGLTDSLRNERPQRNVKAASVSVSRPTTFLTPPRVAALELQSSLSFDADSYRCASITPVGIAFGQNTATYSKGVSVSEAENSFAGTSRTEAEAAGGTWHPCGGGKGDPFIIHSVHLLP